MQRINQFQDNLIKKHANEASSRTEQSVTKLCVFTVTRTDGFMTPKTDSWTHFGDSVRHLHTTEDHYDISTKRNLKNFANWSTSKHNQSWTRNIHTMCSHSGIQIHTSCITACVWTTLGFCLPSVGTVTSAASSVAGASAEVRGYILRLASRKALDYIHHWCTLPTKVWNMQVREVVTGSSLGYPIPGWWRRYHWWVQLFNHHIGPMHFVLLLLLFLQNVGTSTMAK